MNNRLRLSGGSYVACIDNSCGGCPALLRGQLPLPAQVLALGLGDPLPLAFPDQRPLELRHSPDDLELELLERAIIPGEGQVFLVELDENAPAGQFLHEAKQILEVPGQPVYGMNVERVLLPDVLQACDKLGPLQVRRTGLVLEYPVQLHARGLRATGCQWPLLWSHLVFGVRGLSRTIRIRESLIHYRPGNSVPRLMISTYPT